MSIGGRVAKLERTHGADAGPCVLCERREQAAQEPAREFGPEWQVENYTTVEMGCPLCGSPFTVAVEVVERREAA